MSYQGYSGENYPQPGGQPPKKPSPWGSPAVMIAIIAGVVLLAGGVVGAVIYTSGKSTTAAPASSGEPTNPAPGTETGQPSPQPPETVIVQPPVTVTHPPTTTTPTSQVTVSGADRQGFLSGPRCNVSEDNAVFVGYTSRSEIVICQVGDQVGRNYYKGYADGNSTEVSYPTRSGNTFVATNGNVEYIVSPSSLTIRQNGSVIGSETMIDSWVD